MSHTSPDESRLAFLEFLEGKPRSHVNPLNYTLLLNNPPGVLHRSPLPSDAVGALQAAPEWSRPGAPFPWVLAHLGWHGPAVQCSGASCVPGLIAHPLQGLWDLIAASG